MKSIIFVAVILIFGIWHYGLSFLLTIFAISFLIFFHELGHFLAARQLGVIVNVFSIGFGEKLYSKRFGNTTYCLSAIPIGGYVSLEGQDDSNPTMKSDKEGSYNKLSALGRIYILFAGPFFNIFLAFLIYLFLGFIGVDRIAPKIGYIEPNSAASIAKLDANDTILAINGIKIFQWNDIKEQIKNTEPTSINIKRNNKDFSVILKPKIGESKTIFGENINRPLVGIYPANEKVRLYYRGFDDLKFALNETYNAGKLIFLSLEKLVEGIVSPKELGGIVIMADITSKAADIGVRVFAVIVALISVNLGIINLFPIPALDGGHIMFNLFELIFRRPVNERIFSILTYCGIAFLFAIMAFTVANDILRLSGVYN